MKFSLPAKSLATAIQNASKIVERKNTIPILSNALLVADRKALSIKATNLDMEIQLTLEAEVEKPGTTTVPAHLLSDIARKLPGEAQLTLSLDKDGRTMTAAAGRSRFALQVLPSSDFPELTAGTMTHVFRMKGDTLRDLIDHVKFAISTEETRYYLNGVYAHTVMAPGQSTKLRLVSTDGHRLARTEFDAPDGAEGMPGVIIPRKMVEQLAILGGAAEDDEIQIELSEAKIRVEHDGTVITSKLIDGTFPDYQRVIPPAPNLQASCDRAALAQAVDRVATVSSERGRAVKMTFRQGEVLLAVNNPDAGSGLDSVDCDYPGTDPLEIGFNARYVNDVMTAMGGEKVMIGLTDAGSPTIFRRDDAPGLLVVLMPMRV